MGKCYRNRRDQTLFVAQGIALYSIMYHGQTTYCHYQSGGRWWCYATEAEAQSALDAMAKRLGWEEVE